jgi:acid phosphatase
VDWRRRGGFGKVDIALWAFRRSCESTTDPGGFVFLRRGLASVSVGIAVMAAAPSAGFASEGHHQEPDGINHIVVIYEENHSFDNLFGGWEGVNGVRSAAASGHLTQLGADGQPLACLPQNDVNLKAVPATCTGTSNGVTLDSAFRNGPFLIDNSIKPDDKTCPAPGVFAANGIRKDAPGALPGGCTEDLVHRYYQEQYQIDGGRMDRYTLGSDALGLTMGRYDTRQLPIYQYLHSRGAPNYAIADNFFQGAFGGSFLNHQWLVAANTPQWTGAAADGSPSDLHSVVGPDGVPRYYPLQTATAGVKDGALTQAANPDGSCKVPAAGPTPKAGTTCGDYAVNTIQPAYQPFAPGTSDTRKLPPLTSANIGDRLNAKNVDWAWYSGGWDNANGNTAGSGWTNGGNGASCTSTRTAANATYPYCPDATFQYHHQPLNYYADLAPGTQNRAKHLLDEVQFVDSAKKGTLKPVSFIKPLGEENEHPGYASEHTGSDHLVDLLKAIEGGPQARSTMVIVTYDEFGGQWDHVSPPTGAGVSDKWGPGTRVPTLLLSPRLERDFSVDHTSHDTTSILATIEHRFRLAPLGTRDAAVKDLFTAFREH